jgi:hypothetical protein
MPRVRGKEGRMDKQLIREFFTWLIRENRNFDSFDEDPPDDKLIIIYLERDEYVDENGVALKGGVPLPFQNGMPGLFPFRILWVK